MNERGKTLSWIALLMEFVLLAGIVAVKMIYYLERYQDRYYKTFAGFVAWTAVSLFISLLPVLFLIISSAVGVKYGDYENHAVFLALYLKWVVINFLIEAISLIVSIKGIDSMKVTIAERMLICHAVSLVPFFVMFSTRKKVEKNIKNPWDF